MIGDAVLDRPLHAAAVNDFPVAQLVDTGGIEDLEILERIAIDHNDVRKIAGSHATEVCVATEDVGVVAGGVLNDLDRLEASFLLKLQLTNESEAIHLIDEPSVITDADHAALALEVAQC